MKKFVAMLLALLLVLVNVAALAADGPSMPNIRNAKDGNTRAAETPEYSVGKDYTTSGTSNDVYPIELLKFTVTKENASAPDITVGTNNTFQTNGAKHYDIPVNVPAVSAYASLGAGMYHYTVTEVAPDAPSQSAAYNTESITFNVDVYVTYVKDTETGLYTNELERKAIIYSGEKKLENIDASAKESEFKNTYSVGALQVTKNITGSLADPNKVFTIKVTLNSTNTVANVIKITNSATSVTGDVTTDTTSGAITIANGWKGTKTVTFTAKGGQSILIENIPTGVTYTIEETGVTRINPDNLTNQINAANDKDAYAVTGEVTTAAAIGTEKVEKEIVNKKDIQVPMGVSLETLPYVLILAVAAMGAVVLVLRKREEY